MKDSFQRERKARVASMANHGHYLARRITYSDEFYTPVHVPLALGIFDLDPCAAQQTSHASVNIRRPKDGLAVSWTGRVWLNPPYSNIYDWIAKFEAHGNGIILVNARCDTGWFQRLARSASGLLFLKGRLRFIRPALPRVGPPVGSVLIGYGEQNAEALRLCSLPGVFMVPHLPPEPTTENKA